MKLATFNRLAKMMALTFSESDGEALNAIRAANKILIEGELTWDNVFKRLVTVEMDLYEADMQDSQPPPAPHKTTQEKDGRIEEALDLVLATTQEGSFRDMIQSYHTQWEAKSFLSAKQKEVLFNAADRTRKRNVR